MSNLSRTSLDTDNVFLDGASTQLPTMTGDVGSGFGAVITVGV